MENQHSEQPGASFKRLKFGQLPEGTHKFCSNWKEMWEEAFEPVDNLLVKGKVFKANNKEAKKRNSKIRKKTLIFHHCGLLGKRSSEGNRLLLPKVDRGDLNEEHMGMIVTELQNFKDRIKLLEVKNKTLLSRNESLTI